MGELIKLAEGPHGGLFMFAVLIGFGLGWKARADLREKTLTEKIEAQHDTIRELKATVEKLREKLGYL